MTIDCALSGTTKAVCDETVSMPSLTPAPSASSEPRDNVLSHPQSTIATLTGSDLPPFQKVVITAGLSNLKAAGAQTTGSATSGMGSTASGSGVKSTASNSGAGSTASSSGSTAKSSSGALVQEPVWVVGMGGMLAVGLAAFAL